MDDPQISPRGRALLAAAAAAREVADLAYAAAASVDDTDPAGTKMRVQRARHVVIAAQAVRRWQVIAELLGGATWEDVCDALGLGVATAKGQFEATVTRLLESGSTHRDPVEGAVSLGDDVTGSHLDPDPAGTAATLDAWLRRHADWLPVEDPGPVTRALRIPADQPRRH